MDADVFITIAFCAAVALVGIGGALFVRHEWRYEALRADADRRELSRLAAGRRGRAGQRGERTEDHPDGM